MPVSTNIQHINACQADYEINTVYEKSTCFCKSAQGVHTGEFQDRRSLRKGCGAMSEWMLNVKPYDVSLQKLASSFCSGNSYLDQFLKSAHSLDPSYGKTYVLLSDHDELIIGYYNLGMGYIEECIDHVRVKMGGAVHINAFAMDTRYQDLLQEKLPDGSKMYLADFLLLDCLDRIEQIRENSIGCAFVTLCATEEGFHLYRRHGFERIEEEMWFSREEEGQPFASMYYAIDIE